MFSPRRRPLPCTVVLRAASLRDRLLRNRRLLPACALLGAATALQGCVAVGGTARHECPNHECPTVGRQLIDLKAALDAGAMTEAEYASAKQQLLTAKS
jgi:hypothetical protein